MRLILTPRSCSGISRSVRQAPTDFELLVAGAPRAGPTGSALSRKARRLPSPGTRLAVCVPLAESSCLSRWLLTALAAHLPFFAASPDRHAPAPPRSGSSLGDVLARHPQAHPVIAGRQTPGPKARKAAPGQRRSPGRAPSDAAADGWPPSAAGPRSRTLLWRRRFLT